MFETNLKLGKSSPENRFATASYYNCKIINITTLMCRVFHRSFCKDSLVKRIALFYTGSITLQSLAQNGVTGFFCDDLCGEIRNKDSEFESVQ